MREYTRCPSIYNTQEAEPQLTHLILLCFKKSMTIFLYFDTLSRTRLALPHLLCVQVSSCKLKTTEQQRIGRLVLARILKYQAVAFGGYGGDGFLFCAYYFS